MYSPCFFEDSTNGIVARISDNSDSSKRSPSGEVQESAAP